MNFKIQVYIGGFALPFVTEKSNASSLSPLCKVSEPLCGIFAKISKISSEVLFLSLATKVKQWRRYLYIIFLLVSLEGATSAAPV